MTEWTKAEVEQLRAAGAAVLALVLDGASLRHDHRTDATAGSDGYCRCAGCEGYAALKAALAALAKEQP